MKEQKKDTRRSFLSNGWKLGLASILGGAALAHLKDGFASESIKSSGNMVELMDTEGNIILVDEEQVEEMARTGQAHEVRRGIPGRKFVMVVDLAKCQNKLACQRSCILYTFSQALSPVTK